jgi:hypothetical protein
MDDDRSRIYDLLEFCSWAYKCDTAARAKHTHEVTAACLAMPDEMPEKDLRRVRAGAKELIDQIDRELRERATGNRKST